MKYSMPPFLFAPDPVENQLFIVHSGFPICIILVTQHTPAQLLVVESELPDLDDEELDPDELADIQKQLAEVLKNAAEFYRNNNPAFQNPESTN